MANDAVQQLIELIPKVKNQCKEKVKYVIIHFYKIHIIQQT